MSKVLWIEDELASLRDRMLLLQSSLDIELDFAATISLALRKLMKTCYNAIIHDLTVPLGELPAQLSSLEEAFDSRAAAAGFGFLTLCASKFKNDVLNFTTVPPMLICINHALTEIEHLLREIPTTVLFLPKRVLYFNETEFIDTVKQLTNAPRRVAPASDNGAPPQPGMVDQNGFTFSRFAHDQRRYVQHTANVLHSVARSLGVVDRSTSMSQSTMQMRNKIDQLMRSCADAIERTLDNVDSDILNDKASRRGIDMLEDV